MDESQSIKRQRSGCIKGSELYMDGGELTGALGKHKPGVDTIQVLSLVGFQPITTGFLGRQG